MSARTPQGFPTFPGFRYPPPVDGVPGEAKLFQTAADVPEGWSDHPDGVEASEAAAKLAKSGTKTHTATGSLKFPGWRVPPGAVSLTEAKLFQTADEVPEGWTDGLVDPSEDPAKSPDKTASPAPAKAPAAVKKAAAKEVKEPAKTAPTPPPPAPVTLTRDQAVARLVAEFGYQANDPDMAQASDDAVLAVLTAEEAKRGNA